MANFLAKKTKVLARRKNSAYFCWRQKALKFRRPKISHPTTTIIMIMNNTISLAYAMDCVEPSVLYIMRGIYLILKTFDRLLWTTHFIIWSNIGWFNWFVYRSIHRYIPQIYATLFSYFDRIIGDFRIKKPSEGRESVDGCVEITHRKKRSSKIENIFFEI